MAQLRDIFQNTGVTKLTESENDLGTSLKTENTENTHSFADGGDFSFKWLISSSVTQLVHSSGLILVNCSSKAQFEHRFEYDEGCEQKIWQKRPIRRCENGSQTICKVPSKTT